MLRKILLVFSFVVAGTVLSHAQTGSLKIKLVDKANGEPMPFANVLVEQNGAKVAINQTNLDGEVQFTALPPGKYDVKATFVGYQTIQQTGIIVSADKVTYPRLAMSTVAGGVELKAVEVSEYKAPLIDPETKSGSTITRDQFINMAQKNVNTIVAQTAGVFQADQGGALSIRGSRADATSYFIDGVRVIGGFGVSQLGVEQITTITGGIPAQYGDATGGIVSITTRGVQPKFFASVQGESSQYLDAFGHNLLGFSVGSPLYSKRDTAGNKKAVIGFVLSGEFIHRKDPNPSAIGSYKVKDDVLKNLEENPLTPSPLGAGNLRAAEFITMNDLEKIKFRQNVAQSGINLNGKLQFKIADNTDLTIGGNYSYNNQSAFVYEYALFNPQNNPQTINNTYRMNARLVQRFNTKTETEKEKSSSAITNAVYTLQAEYTKNMSVTQDADHKDNFFDYGYVGKFDRLRTRYTFYNAGNDQYYPNFAYSASKNAFVQTGAPGDSLVLFTPGTINQTGANYTSQFYEYENNKVHNYNEIQNGLGLLNGDRPGNIYSLWYNTGRQYNGYNIRNDDIFRVYTSFSASVKKHNIQVGFEYEQRIQRGFNVTPIDLWTLMRQLTNSHLTQLDTANPTRVNLGGTYDYIFYDQKYDGASQKQFDKSLREKLGMQVNNTSLINTDAYAPNFYSLGMFSPDELLNNGSALVSYWGYDYTGKKSSATPSFDAFFNDKDPAGNFKRQIGALQPIYIAGYIQDQFDIEDLKFRLGLRIDRYDANQKVLKDKYSLYEMKTVGEVSNLGNHPTSIGNDYVVYVDDAKNPSKIVGYRNEDKWYNPQGTEVNDPNVLAKNASISKLYPYLVDPNSSAISSKAFKDYEPQINLMPRIAFAFPISDLAQFNANYDITTQRPGNNLALPTEYLFWTYSGQSPFVTNAALQPQRTTSYEIGYKQVLNERKNAAITLSAFYKELRNLIQIRNVVQAYPSQYLTYDNIDFATVKGFSVSFDLRRTNNVQIGANYTLQFADGTGSGATDGLNLVSAGLPNLRTLIPLSYDRRHTMNVVLDYRFGTRSEYNGPVWIRHKGQEQEKVLKLLQDVGFNLAMRAGSGTPFSRQTNITQDVATGISQRSSLSGNINGSNLPWSYWLDLKIDKNLIMTWRAEQEGKAAKTGSLNVYILFLNLLNTQNVLGAYRYTGNANDDGFLSSPDGKKYSASQNSPTAFNDLYSVKVNNPSLYSMPRSIRIGFMLGF